MKDFLIRTSFGDCGTYLNKEDVIELIYKTSRLCQSINAKAEMFRLAKSIEEGEVTFKSKI